MLKALLFFICLFSAFVIRAQQPSFLQKPSWSILWNEEEESPLDPGWREQYFMMKKNSEGKIPRLPFEKIREQEINGGTLRSIPLFHIKELGPQNMGGRTRAILIDRANNASIFAGSVSGGIWHSIDSGVHWTVINDEMTALSISSICQDFFNSQIIYVGTGEGWGNADGIIGNGIYRSTDGGSTFDHLPATEAAAFDYIFDIASSPADSGRIYIATRSNGLYRSDNGGDSLKNVFPTSSTISDIEITPSGGVWIGVYYDGLYYSPTGDSGTFVHKITGLPSPGQVRRIEFAIAPSDTTVMYAAYENTAANGFKGIYRTSNAGQSWTEVVNPEDFGFYVEFTWYSMCIAIKPDDPNFVVLGVGDLMFTNNGGNSWAACMNLHADHHSIVFNPLKPAQIYEGNDGGIYRMSISNMSYTNVNLNEGYGTIQYYAGCFFPTGTSAYGGTQDNGTHYCKEADGEFFHVLGGDGAYCGVNQQYPGTAYASSQNGHIEITYNADANNPDFSPTLNELDADGDGDVDEGAYFINPFDLGLANGDYIVFVTYKRLWHSLDAGYYWIPAMEEVDENNASPYAIGISRDFSPTIYMGGSSAIFYRIDDAYNSIPGDEVNLSSTVPAEVNNDFIECITVHPQDDNICYVAFGNYATDPRVWKVTEGKTANPVWTNISGDLPVGLPVNYIDVDPARPNDFFLAATDYGLYVSENAGQHWQKVTDIPNVFVQQVKVRPGDRRVFVYTHGRGMWTATLDSVNVGVPAVTQNFYAEAFPNPCFDYLQVKCSEPHLEVTVRDVNNRTLIPSKMISGNESLDVSSLAAGIYFLEMKSDGRVTLKKIVKAQ